MRPTATTCLQCRRSHEPGRQTAKSVIFTVLRGASGPLFPFTRGTSHMTILVSSFGAVGNGTTDDTAAIQSAINAAQTAKDVLLFEPRKIYRTTAPLIVK